MKETQRGGTLVMNLIVAVTWVLFSQVVIWGEAGKVSRKGKNGNEEVRSEPATMRWYVTTLDKSELFERHPDLLVGNSDNDLNNVALLSIDDSGSNLKQTMYGYGGALTQSSAYLLHSLKMYDEPSYWLLLNQLFNTSFSSWNDISSSMKILRLPISGSDFDAGDWYTYDETSNDYNLDYVNLDIPEAQYVIPVLLDILSINGELQLMACPWTAPTWLKTSNDYTWGSLNDDDTTYETYANYLIKVIDLFATEYDIKIKWLSIQNEPLNEPNSYPVTRIESYTMATIVTKISQSLTKLKEMNKIHKYTSDIKIVVYDHNWDEAQYAINVYNDAGTDVSSIISGAAFHCYAGKVYNQSIVNSAFPDKEVYFTECTGYGESDFSGNIPWNTEHLYIGSVNNWATMVMHWNLVLDENYGPHNGGCSDCRGIVTLNSNSYHVTFNEEWYGVTHFGKFISPNGGNSQLLTVNWDKNGNGDCLDGIAMTTDNNHYNIIISNFCNHHVFVIVQMQSSHNYVNVTIPVGLSTLFGSM